MNNLRSTILLVVLYLSAAVLANLSVLVYGPSVVILNAFLLIGYDLVVRDYLHDRWKDRFLWARMGLLIATGSFLSFLINSDAKNIAFASFTAFCLSGLTDTITYQLLRKHSKMVRVNGSNLFSSLVDSLVFPFLAFGAFLPYVTLGQWFAKLLGGFVWSVLFLYLLRRKNEKGRSM